jgi:hypothetical protein
VLQGQLEGKALERRYLGEVELPELVCECSQKGELGRFRYEYLRVRVERVVEHAHSELVLEFL